MKKKVPSVTMNVLIKTSTLFKSIKTNYQENFSRKLIFKIKVFYPSEIFNQFSLIHESITHILTVKIVFFPAQTSTRTHAPTVLHGSIISTNEIDNNSKYCFKKRPLFVWAKR